MWELKSQFSNQIVTRVVMEIKNKLVRMSFVRENGAERVFVAGMLH